jgi:hypothetical protein
MTKKLANQPLFKVLLPVFIIFLLIIASAKFIEWRRIYDKDQAFINSSTTDTLSGGCNKSYIPGGIEVRVPNEHVESFSKILISIGGTITSSSPYSDSNRQTISGIYYQISVAEGKEDESIEVIKTNPGINSVNKLWPACINLL